MAFFSTSASDCNEAGGRITARFFLLAASPLCAPRAQITSPPEGSLRRASLMWIASLPAVCVAAFRAYHRARDGEVCTQLVDRRLLSGGQGFPIAPPLFGSAAARRSAAAQSRCFVQLGCRTALLFRFSLLFCKFEIYADFIWCTQNRPFLPRVFPPFSAARA